jgi:hypothetical protein
MRNTEHAAQIICKNIKGIVYVQKRSFLLLENTAIFLVQLMIELSSINSTFVPRWVCKQGDQMSLWTKSPKMLPNPFFCQKT